MFIFSQGGQDASVDLPMRDTNGALLTGLVHNSAGASCYYRRPGAAPVQIPLVTLANAQAAHADGGFVEIDATNESGMYRLDLPDAALASGENFVTVYIEFTASRPTIVLILLDPHPNRVAFAVQTDAGNSVTQFKTDLTQATNDHWNDAYVVWRSGALAGQVERITDYDGTNKIIHTNAFTGVPADGDEGLIVNF